MAWNDSSEIVVAGTGEAYVGAVGATLPTTAVASLSVATWTGLGFHTEDGVSVNSAPDVLEIRAWQSKFPVRTQRQTEDFRITFSLMQWNEINVPLAFGGGSVVSDGGSGYRYNPPSAADSMDYRALVVDVHDGARHGRFVIPRGAAVEGVESQFANSAEAPLPVTFQAQPLEETTPWYFLTDDAAAFAVGS